MTHQIALSFEDGVTRFITCREDQTVADASYRARINIPLDCRDGACGTCKAFCDSGEFDGGTYIDDALTADEADKGYVLPCSMKPLSDLVLQIASTSAVAKTQASTFTAEVTGLDRLSPTTVALTIATPDRAKLTFLPGQYVNLEVPGTDQSRSYSFSNAPDDDDLTFLIKITSGGVMSEYLTDRAAVGDSISFTGPNGSFFLREADRPALLLAGGTGLAPILSILRRLRDEGSERPVHLIYGVSSDDDLVEVETLEHLAQDMKTLTWDHCVADPGSTAANTGYVMSLIGDEHVNNGDVAVYLCGPPPMVEAVRTHFSDEGIEPAGFYFEKFALSGTGADASATAAAPVETDAEPTDIEPDADEMATTVDHPEDDVIEDEAEATEMQAVVHVTSGSGARLIISSDARAIAGQIILPATEELAEVPSAASAVSGQAETARAIAGQAVFADRTKGEAGRLAPDVSFVQAKDARAIAGQLVLTERPELVALVERPEPPVRPAEKPTATGGDGYQIGEEHPSIGQSDDIFEARKALELGAVDLVVNRLDSRQLAGYRLLAEATLPYVDGERFVDAASYTQTNAVFHDYLFMQTGNEHLLKAYQSLGVKGRMEEVLRNATWCHPRCATDHVEIVEALEKGDRAEARQLFADHADRSKQTMRRAMEESSRSSRPAIPPGRLR